MIQNTHSWYLTERVLKRTMKRSVIYLLNFHRIDSSVETS